MKAWLKIVILSTLCVGSLWAEEAPRVKAELKALTEGVAPGAPFTINVELTMREGWHTYGNPPGESGIPTEIEWQLPEGFKAGSVQWPKPETFTLGGIKSYGYSGKIDLPVKIVPPENLKIGEEVTIQAKVSWLACKEICIPGEAKLSTVLPVIQASVGMTVKDTFGGVFKQGGPLNLNKALLLAFLGGLILNLMPCVFPVIAIKVLGFVELSGQSYRKSLVHSLLFSLGVIGSFLVLAGALIALRESGELLGWGFQLQNPYFVMGLIVLLFMVSLNFLGWFEVGLGLQSKVGQVKTQGGLTGSFLSGVLATLLATPCTAPFMGAAIGFAFTQSLQDYLAIFAMLGVGMSTPYLVLSLMPFLVKMLPRPGAWMDQFKQFMAFPMLATTLWLGWVLTQQVGRDVLMPLLIGLLCISFGCWLYGAFQLKRKGVATMILWLAVFLGFIGWGVRYSIVSIHERIDETGMPTEEASAGPKTVAYKGDFKRYDPEEVVELIKQSQPVFIDFTASWCITCQWNKKSVLNQQKVVDAFVKRGVNLRYADWTSKDPRITAELEKYGRSGVPTYVLYSGIPNDPPKVLPELLSTSLLLETLSALPKRVDVETKHDKESRKS